MLMCWGLFVLREKIDPTVQKNNYRKEENDSTVFWF